MDRLEKALGKLSTIERETAAVVIRRILRGDHKGLDIKKLKGFEDIFRVRKGNVRIIFRYDRGRAMILKIARRDEKTYGKF